MTHTHESLLTAVGVTRELQPYLWTPAWHSPMPGGTPVSELPATFEPNGFEYTGPALDSPELDALLWVEGQRWCRENWMLYEDINDAFYERNQSEIDHLDASAMEWLLFYCTYPGHALAKAIAEVRG